MWFAGESARKTHLAFPYHKICANEFEALLYVQGK